MPLAAITVMLAIISSAHAQRPGGGRGGRPEGPPPGANRADQDLQNQQVGNQRLAQSAAK